MQSTSRGFGPASRCKAALRPMYLMASLHRNDSLTNSETKPCPAGPLIEQVLQAKVPRQVKAGTPGCDWFYLSKHIQALSWLSVKDLAPIGYLHTHQIICGKSMPATVHKFCVGSGGGINVCARARACQREFDFWNESFPDLRSKALQALAHEMSTKISKCWVADF